ncbi:MAG: Asp-tRNA(Asn)/Glu-tRNA(Gln) amidotransferase subunit GatC [Patescibacteria group bacterium]|nr:Asp-tRNA(Asn)/Glu-tRNA(Gln) amidotransferase subunit GatC [Patescibacteria group bacterium]
MLTQEEIKKLALLARLEFTPGELKKFGSQLSNILDYVAQLSEVPTENVEPTSQVTGLENVLREDEVLRRFTREEILSTSNQSKCDGLIKIKPIFDRE